MRNILILLLFLSVLSCKKDTDISKTSVKKVTVIKPFIRTDSTAKNIDSIALKQYGSKILHAFYELSAHKTVWQSKKKRQIILQQLHDSDQEGLNPKAYKITKLEKIEEKFASLKDDEIVSYDMLLTHNLQKYIAHLTNGRLTPSNLYKDWDLPRNKININLTIANLLSSDSTLQKIENLKPNHVVYRKLKTALVLINQFPDETFSTIPFEKKLVKNDTNPSLVAIKKRLIYWNDMERRDSLTSIYDSKTVVAIEKFQNRHGLNADGIIGKGTIDALNFSKNQRRAQILVNLERWKWYPKDMGKEYVIINIPDYKLRLVRAKDTIETHKVIVGTAKRRTPILSSKLTNVVFNPTWTVPPTILREDVIPSISRNRGYLEQKNIQIYNKKNGAIVTANQWKESEAYSYRYVQSPGSFNSLGMMKILFENRFSVYLHDTNHRDYFSKTNRSLSSGCVRVDNPLKLTEYLLDDTTNWSLDKITETLKSKKTKYVKIKKDAMVQLLYWTAWSNQGKLIFREDIYGLDADLYAKLN